MRALKKPNTNYSNILLATEQTKMAELRERLRSSDGNLKKPQLGPLKPIADQPQAKIQKADRDSNGVIECGEVVVPEKMQGVSEEQMKMMFRKFDRDENGYITAAELAGAMAKIGRRLSLLELNGMIKEADSNGDGKIDFPEFSLALSSSSAFLN